MNREPREAEAADAEADGQAGPGTAASADRDAGKSSSGRKGGGSDASSYDSSSSSSGSASGKSDSDRSHSRHKHKHHKKKKSKKHSSKKDKRSRSRGSSSSSGSSSDSDSDSDDERERRRRKKRRKEKKKKHKSKSKSKKEKKHKKKHKKHKSVAEKVKEFGAYGILHTEDRYSKQSEFYLWLREVKNIEPETLPVYAMTEHFETYAEDYNTVTFPDDKYYNLEAWYAKEAQKAARAERKGLPMATAAREATAGSFSILQDETEKRRNHAARNTMKMSRAQAEEMRQVMRERSEQFARKDLGMKVDEKAGVRTTSKMRGLLGFGEKAM